jgi:transmembrane sensor
MMNNSTKHIDFESLVASYLAGNASPQEADLLENMVKSDEEKRKLFIEIKRTWMLAYAAKQTYNQELAWKKIISQTEKSPEKQIVRPLYPKASFSTVLKIAAAITVLIVGMYSAYHYAYLRDKTLVAELKPDGIELIDGSKVTVNAGSSITYPSRFSGKERRVVLKGEAFFEVAANPEQEFVIEVQDIEVRVLGTSFNIKSMPGNEAVEVSVITGRVSIVAANMPELILTAGETGIYRKSEENLIKEEAINPNTISWKTRQLVFENTGLTEVFAVIESTYGVQVKIRDAKLGNCKLTASFIDKPVDDVLNIISETFNLRYVRSEGTIWATGEGCE